MGTEVDRESFSAGDYARFEQRLGECIDVLDQLLARPGFGVGPPSLGAELELALVDSGGAALHLNRAVLAETMDPRFTVEIDRFNLECNLRPTPLRGRPFAALRGELESALAEISSAAARHDGRVVPIGILPTLRTEDLGEAAMTDSARYRVLQSALLRQRGRPFHLEINGRDSFALDTESVTFEGAATSLQIHLRVSPEELTDAFNAAELATGPVLAVSGNSPILLAHRLWDETRVALFKQAVDDRTRRAQRLGRPPRVGFGQSWVTGGALELFAATRAHDVLLPILGDEDLRRELDDGQLPRLRELRLHQGTVWSWNRPIYDPADGGHLRIELRALPAGPSIPDMLANTAFLIGLIRGLMPRMPTWTRELDFDHAEDNFYRAAQHGLAATLCWPSTESGAEPRRVNAPAVALELLPVARAGLLDLEVAPDDFEPWLAVLEQRCLRQQSGARWQLRGFDQLRERGLDRRAALHEMLEHYLAHSHSGTPVHDWPAPPGASP